MKTNTSSRAGVIFPVILTLVGILIGLLLAVLAVWADYESTTYGFSKRANTPFDGLSCPILMGQNESRVVSIRVSNPTEKALAPSVMTDISTRTVFDSSVEYIQVGPGESVTLQKSVGPGNVDLGRFIFVSTLVYSTYPIPSRENTCGIYVLPIDGSGSWVLITGTILSILLTSAGAFLLYKRQPSSKGLRSLIFLVVITALTMLFSFIGWWVQGIVLLVISILALWSLLTSFI